MAHKHIEIRSDNLYDLFNEDEKSKVEKKRNNVKKEKRTEKGENSKTVSQLEKKISLTNDELDKLKQLLSALDNNEFDIIRRKPILVKHNYFNIIGLTFDFYYNEDEYIKIYFRKEDVEKIFDNRIIVDNQDIYEVRDYFFIDEDTINDVNLKNSIILSLNINNFSKINKNV